MDLKDAMGHLVSKDTGHPDVTAVSLAAEITKASGEANVSVEPATPMGPKSILPEHDEEPDEILLELEAGEDDFDEE